MRASMTVGLRIREVGAFRETIALIAETASSLRAGLSLSGDRATESEFEVKLIGFAFPDHLLSQGYLVSLDLAV